MNSSKCSPVTWHDGMATSLWPGLETIKIDSGDKRIPPRPRAEGLETTTLDKLIHFVESVFHYGG